MIQRIVDQIEAEGLAPGDLIGTQSDLCERHQVSPGVFFQATRILVDRGVAELRRGSGGGLFVADHAFAQCGQRMSKYFECIGITFEDCGEVNRTLQELCMRHACGALPLATVDRIREIQRQVATASYSQRNYLLSQLSQEYAEGTGNVVLALLYRCITDVLLDFSVDEELSSPIVPQVVLIELSMALSEAVIAGSHEEAAALYALFRDALIRKIKLEDPFRTDGARQRIVRQEAVRRALPDRLATVILREIIANGWGHGHRLGNEDDLLAQYGVSRATFRQAIALLREYSIVSTRRGSAGGLIVTTPDFSLIRETALEVMIGRGATLGDAMVVWTAFALLAFDKAMGHSSEAVIEACGRAREAAKSNARDGAGVLMAALFESADLRMLTMFAHLIDELASRLSPRGEPVGWAETTRLIDEFEASVAGGDHARARAALSDLVRATGIAIERR